MVTRPIQTVEYEEADKAAQKQFVGKITKKTSTDSLIQCVLTYLKLQNLRAESEGYINSKKDAAESHRAISGVLVDSPKNMADSCKEKEL